MTVPQLQMMLAAWVLSLFVNVEVLTLITLIFAQFLTGVLAAVKQQRFDFTKMGDFFRDHFLPSLLVWAIVKTLALAVTFSLKAYNLGLSLDIFNALPAIAFVLLVLRTVAYCYASCREIVPGLPDIPGLPSNEPAPVPVTVVTA